VKASTRVRRGSLPIRWTNASLLLMEEHIRAITEWYGGALGSQMDDDIGWR
jgi:hypothetical protein